jgi:hypothetical protein
MGAALLILYNLLNALLTSCLKLGYVRGDLNV